MNIFFHVSFGYVLCFPLFSCNKSVYLSVIFVFFFNGGGIMGQGGRNALRRGFCHCLRIDVVKLSDVRGFGPVRVVKKVFSKKTLQFIWRCFDPPDNSLLTHISTNDNFP